MLIFGIKYTLIIKNARLLFKLRYLTMYEDKRQASIYRVLQIKCLKLMLISLARKPVDKFR